VKRGPRSRRARGLRESCLFLEPRSKTSYNVTVTFAEQYHDDMVQSKSSSRRALQLRKFGNNVRDHSRLSAIIRGRKRERKKKIYIYIYTYIHIYTYLYVNTWDRVYENSTGRRVESLASSSLGTGLGSHHLEHGCSPTTFPLLQRCNDFERWTGADVDRTRCLTSERSVWFYYLPLPSPLPLPLSGPII